MDWQSDTGWKLAYSGSLSTDLEGVNRILGGAAVEDFPTEETFKNKHLLERKERRQVLNRLHYSAFRNLQVVFADVNAYCPSSQT